MTSVASPAPSGATPIDGIVVPLAELNLAAHEPGVTAAVELAAAFFHARVEGFLVTTEEAGR